MKVFDRIKVSATVEGSTDPILLGAPLPGFLTAVQAGVTTGDEFPYLIVGGSQWETGRGSFNSATNTVTRLQCHSSSNNANFVNFVAGPKIFMCAVSAAYLKFLKDVADAALASSSDKVPVAGGTMTGYLTLSGDPVQNLHASTKNYVDASITAAIGGSAGPVTGVIRASFDYVATSGQTTFSVPGGYPSANALDVYINGVKVPQSGFTATDLSSVVVPARAAYDNVSIVCTRAIEEDAIVRKAGDSMVGFLTLHSDPVFSMHAATRQFVLNEAAAAVATVPWTIVTTSSSAAAGTNYIVDLQASNVTLTLPASPSPNSKIRVKWVRGATNNLTIARNGNNIAGAALDYIPPEDDGSLELVYANSSIGWAL